MLGETALLATNPPPRLDALPVAVLAHVSGLTTPRVHFPASARALLTASHELRVRVAWVRHLIGSVSAKDANAFRSTNDGFPLANQLEIPFVWYLRSLFDKNLGKDSLAHYNGGSVSRMRRDHPFQSDDVIAAFYRPRHDCSKLDDQLDSLTLDDDEGDVGASSAAAPAPSAKGKPVKRAKGQRKKKRPLHGKGTAVPNPPPAAPAMGPRKWAPGVSSMLRLVQKVLTDPPAKPSVSIGQGAMPEGLLLPTFFAYADDLPRMRIALNHLFRLDPDLKTARVPIGVWTKLWLSGHPGNRVLVHQLVEAVGDRPGGDITFGMSLALLALMTWNLEMLNTLLDGNYGVGDATAFIKFCSASSVSLSFLPAMITRIDGATTVPAMLDRLISLGWELDRSRFPYCLASYAAHPELVELFLTLLIKYDAPYVCASQSATNVKLQLRKDMRVFKPRGLTLADVIRPGFMSLVETAMSAAALVEVCDGRADLLSLLDLAMEHAEDPANMSSGNIGLIVFIDQLLRGIVNLGTGELESMDVAFSVMPTTLRQMTFFDAMCSRICSMFQSPSPHLEKEVILRIFFINRAVDQFPSQFTLEDCLASSDEVVAWHAKHAAAALKSLLRQTTLRNSPDTGNDPTARALATILNAFLGIAPEFTLREVVAWHQYIPLWMWQFLAPAIRMFREVLPPEFHDAAVKSVAARRARGDARGAAFIARNVIATMPGSARAE
ncbi:hypothetical protein H9P43_009353 [Blastocladiella emersonii ATCC 22665]|nr:hypothetical protein H9P43_009353 [Blastocladiella emersonii ATCC 22665]